MVAKILLLTLISVATSQLICLDQDGPSTCGTLSVNQCNLNFGTRCRRSCRFCLPPSQCQDTGANCSTTTCTTQLDISQCPVACKACVPNDGNSCYDIQPTTDCIRLRNQVPNECFASVVYMKELCMLTCNMCPPPPTPPPAPSPAACRQSSNGQVCCSNGCDDCGCSLGGDPCPSGRCENFCTVFGNLLGRRCV